MKKKGEFWFWTMASLATAFGVAVVWWVWFGFGK